MVKFSISCELSHEEHWLAKFSFEGGACISFFFVFYKHCMIL